MWIRSVPFCSVQCKIRLTRNAPAPGELRATYTVEGIPNKASEGRLCVKGMTIRSLLVMGSNPVVSNPNADLVEKALRDVEFLAVADMFLSETARMADVVLPVTAYLVNDGTLSSLEGPDMPLTKTVRANDIYRLKPAGDEAPFLRGQ